MAFEPEQQDSPTQFLVPNALHAPAMKLHGLLGEGHRGCKEHLEGSGSGIASAMEHLKGSGWSIAPAMEHHEGFKVEHRTCDGAP